MIKYISINEFDMAAVTNAVSHYKSAGLIADFDVSRRQEGTVTIALSNPTRHDGSAAVFEIYKIAHKGWLKQKAHWVVQLYSITPGSDPIKKGCVYATTLVYAISEAEHDLNDGFVSVLKFEQAATQD